MKKYFSLLFIAVILFTSFSACSHVENEVIHISSGVYDENGNELENGKVYPMPSRLLFSGSMQPLSYGNPIGEVTLEATVLPVTAINKAVDWSVQWLDPDSDFADGKTVTDYVTVSSESDGALIADVRCYQAFGEKIKVIVTSRENTDITAECVLDFLCRYDQIFFYLDHKNDESYNFVCDSDYSEYAMFKLLPFNSGNFYYDTYENARFPYSYSDVYTIPYPALVMDRKIYIKRSDAFHNALLDADFESTPSLDLDVYSLLSNEWYDVSDSYKGIYNYGNYLTMLTAYKITGLGNQYISPLAYVSGTSNHLHHENYSKLLDVFYSLGDNVAFYIKVVFVHGSDFSDAETIYGCKIDLTSPDFMVQELLIQSDYYF